MTPPDAYHHARELIYAVCSVAGSTCLFDQIDHTQGSLTRAIQQHYTPSLFDYFLHAFNFQGIADSYIERHGLPSWAEIEACLEYALCPKLKSYWTFYKYGYRKLALTCNEPEHFLSCSLPQHELRNGRLNQIAYALFLFIQDIADRDLVSWIDRQLAHADQQDGPDRIAQWWKAWSVRCATSTEFSTRC